MIKCLEKDLKTKGIDLKLNVQFGVGEKIRGQLQSKQIDLARVLDTTYIRMHDENSKIKPFIGEQSEGSIFTPFILFVNSKTGIRSIEDLKKPGEAKKRSIIFSSVAREGFDPNIQNAIMNSLLKMKSKNCLEGIKKDGFLKIEDSDFNKIREMINISIQFDPQ